MLYDQLISHTFLTLECVRHVHSLYYQLDLVLFHYSAILFLLYKIYDECSYTYSGIFYVKPFPEKSYKCSFAALYFPFYECLI